MRGCTPHRPRGTSNKTGIVTTFFRLSRDIAQVSPFLFWVNIIMMLLGAAVWPLMVAILTKLYDVAAVLPGDKGAIGVFALIVALYLGSYVFNSIISNIMEAIAEVLVIQKASYRFAVRLSEHASKMGLLLYENPELLDTMQRARDAEKNQELLETYNSAMSFFGHVLTALSVITVLTTFSFWLLPIALGAAAPAFINKMLRGADVYQLRKRQGKKTRTLDYYWKLLTSRQTVKEMQVMGFGSYLRDRWRVHRTEIAEEEYAIRRKDAVISIFCDTITGIGFCSGIVFSALLVLRGAISPAQFAACVNAFDNIIYNTEHLLRSFGEFFEHAACAANYYAFMDTPEEDVSGRPYGGLQKGIEFDHVSFAYPGCSRDAVSGVSFTIRPGEKVALLGVNGSGKTTLTKLLCGVYPPSGGEIRYDGVPVGEIDKPSLFATLSLVSQNFTKYSLTLRENIGISHIDAAGDDEALMATLTDVDLPQFSREQLDMPMGREFGGADLSVGQWQKLAIARGLFRNYELIVLDEPTSALDPLVEHQILSHLIGSTQGKTAVIVSHRVGFCRHVDKILVMDRGMLVEMGSHEELMEKGGYYSKLFGEQAKWYTDEYCTTR